MSTPRPRSPADVAPAGESPASPRVALTGAVYERLLKKTSGSSRSRTPQRSTLEQVLGSKSTQKVIGQVLTGLFGMAKRR